MKQLRAWFWQLSHQPGLCFWAVFLLWETFGVGLALIPHVSIPVVADDLALLLLALALAACLEAAPAAVRLAGLTVLGVALGFFNLANALFYEFFHTFLNLDTYRTADQAQGASRSIAALLNGKVLLLNVLVPLVLLGAAVWLARGRARRVPRWVALGCVPALALLGIGSYTRHTGFLAVENNPVLHVGRQWLHQMELRHDSDGEMRRSEILNALAETYNLPPESQYLSGTHAAFPLEKLPAQVSRPAKPLNVVVVLMESFRLRESGIGTGHAVIAPHLDALASEGMFFPHFYADGHQTVRGELATLCSVLPNYSGGQVYSTFPQLSLPCLPQILHDAGYQTHWFSAYMSSFGGKGTFLRNHGVQFVHDGPTMNGRKLKHPKLGWGPADEDTAEYVIETLAKAKGPFFAEWMTLSNHHPFDAPFDIPTPPQIEASREPVEFRNYQKGLHYTDHAVNHFIELARTQPWFKDTVFVFLGDHGTWLFPMIQESLTPAEKIEAYFRVPFIIWSPGHVAPKRSEVVASQIDVAPTLLDLLGISAPNAFEGTSLLAAVPPENRFAVMGDENVWSIRQGDDYCYAMGQKCFQSMAPYCPAGFEAKPAGHGCFSYDHDLLDLEASRKSLQLLDEPASARLLARGKRLVDGNKYLLWHDGFFPRPMASNEK